MANDARIREANNGLTEKEWAGLSPGQVIRLPEGL